MNGNGRLRRAMVLAAGRGTRLGRLTADCPKPMLPVCGRPVLEWIIRRLVRFGVLDIVVNLHHSPAAITEHFRDGRDFGASITYSFEPELLGTAGAFKAAEASFRGEPFYLVYGDNLTTCDFTRLAQTHFANHAVTTVALYKKADLGPHSMVEFNGDLRISRFVEKPRVPREIEGWISAGLAVLEPAVFNFLESGVFADFGHDVIPALLAGEQRVFAYPMSGREGLWWLDTEETYEGTCRRWSQVVANEFSDFESVTTDEAAR